MYMYAVSQKLTHQMYRQKGYKSIAELGIFCTTHKPRDLSLKTTNLMFLKI